MIELVRSARLRGSKEAHRLLKMFEVKERLDKTCGQVDVFGVLADLDVVVIFRPLNGLLGAYLKGDQPGVLISTKRTPPIQRFTAAHELGHAILAHEPSLDSPDVLRRAASDDVRGGVRGFASRLQEIEADAFAGDFLLPNWLIYYHCRRQSWAAADLANPEIAYQLSLRCGASYEALLHSLQRNRILPPEKVIAALSVKPKVLKQKIRKRDSWSNAWADTWRISTRDQGSAIPLYVGDLIGVELQQAASSGYLLHCAEPVPSGLFPLDENVIVPPDEIGAHTQKHFIFRAELPGDATLQLVERRPWEPEGEIFSFHLVLQGRGEGLSRSNAPKFLAA